MPPVFSGCHSERFAFCFAKNLASALRCLWGLASAPTFRFGESWRRAQGLAVEQLSILLEWRARAVYAEPGMRDKWRQVPACFAIQKRAPPTNRD